MNNIQKLTNLDDIIQSLVMTSLYPAKGRSKFQFALITLSLTIDGLSFLGENSGGDF